MVIYRRAHGATRTVIRNGQRRVIWDLSCIHCGQAVEAVRKSAKYCGSTCQLNHEYQTGERDRATTTLAAHAAIKLSGFPSRKGKPIAQLRNPIVWAKVSKTKTGRQVPLLQGSNHWAWRGGVDKSVWKTPGYQQWRKAVMRRDKYTCVQCGDARGGNLEADHIKPRYLFPELTLDLDNGRTLCKPCHRKTSTYGTKVRMMSREYFL
jgi:5-methylcytosine-specific restriction endonuclease McrA